MNFIPGWNPGFIAAGQLTSITQVLSATSTGTTITAPVGILAGDLIVLCDSIAGGTLDAGVVPTNFTPIANVIVTDVIRQITSYKLAIGTEGGTSITGSPEGVYGATAKVMLVFRGNKAASALTLGDVGSQATSGNPTAQTITSATGVAPLVVFGFYSCAVAGTPAVNPRTFTVAGSAAKDGELEQLDTSGFTMDTDCWIAWKIYNTAPADVVVDMDDEGDGNALASCYLQMA